MSSSSPPFQNVPYQKNVALLLKTRESGQESQRKPASSLDERGTNFGELRPPTHARTHQLQQGKNGGGGGGQKGRWDPTEDGSEARAVDGKGDRGDPNYDSEGDEHDNNYVLVSNNQKEKM